MCVIKCNKVVKILLTVHVLWCVQKGQVWNLCFRFLTFRKEKQMAFTSNPTGGNVSVLCFIASFKKISPYNSNDVTFDVRMTVKLFLLCFHLLLVVVVVGVVVVVVFIVFFPGGAFLTNCVVLMLFHAA